MFGTHTAGFMDRKKLMDIRLIATDLDGTLLNERKEISEYTRETIQMCLDRGITFMLVSGRCHGDAVQPALEAGLDIMVASANGSRIDRTPHGGTVYERLMNEAECKVCMEILDTCPGRVHVYKKGLTYVRESLAEDRIPHFENRPFSKWKVNFDSEMIEAARKDVYKFEVYSDDPSVLADYGDRLTRAGVLVTSSNPRDIEIQPVDSTKGRAVEVVADILGITKEQIMCFGDYGNDLSLLQAAGVSVAMENGIDMLKRAADIIAPPNTRDGEARVIRHVVFGEDTL